MLRSLHVKNMALIRETEVEFGEGLNILTGETGAGKSLLIGSVNLALGGKFEKDMLRRGEESGLVELVFDCEEERLAEKLKSMDLEPSEDGTVILSRKLSSGKSICRINGETVTAKQVKELSELLIDIHGQHEHQSLLHKQKHLEILDQFASGENAGLRQQVAELYREYREQQEKLNALYDDFSKKYGLISSRANNTAFSTDSSYCLLSSLEVLDDEGNFVRKADMFSKRTIK